MDIEFVCSMCGGTGKHEVSRNNKERMVSCLSSTDTSEELVDNIRFLLAQFIRCDADGVFDVNNPYEEKCEGCAIDRDEIMDRIWHYGELKIKEKVLYFGL